MCDTDLWAFMKIALPEISVLHLEIKILLNLLMFLCL